MSDSDSPGSGDDFRAMIQQFVAENGWKLTDLTDSRAMLRFGMPSGRTQMLYILRYGNTLEFSVPSIGQYDSETAIPHPLSTLLLKRNAQRKIGFWCLEELRGKEVYSAMHNAEMQGMDSAFFSRIVRALVEECDEFDGALLESQQ